MAKFEKCGEAGGKTAFRITASRLGGPMFVGGIEYFDEKRIQEAGLTSETPHWALLHWNGRVDRFETLAEVKNEARKSYV